jgi:hypothetical protein
MEEHCNAFDTPREGDSIELTTSEGETLTGSVTSRKYLGPHFHITYDVGDMLLTATLQFSSEHRQLMAEDGSEHGYVDELTVL